MWIHHNTGPHGRTKLKSLFIARNRSCPHLNSWPTLTVCSILEAVVNVQDPPQTPVGEPHMAKKRARSATHLSEDLYAMLIVNWPSLPQWICPLVSLSALSQPLCNVRQYTLATSALLFPEQGKTLKQSILWCWCKALRVLPSLLQQHAMSSCPVQ